MDWRTVAVLAHVLAAFWYIAGYVGTNVCTEVARRTQSDDERRAALLVSGRLDRWLNAPGGTAVGLTGIATLLAFGYSITTPWIIVSTVLFVGVVATGIVYWGRFGRRVEVAMGVGDWAAVGRLLNDQRSVLVSRIENLVVLTIVTLMVLRPG